MANEKSVSITLAVKNGDLDRSRKVNNLKLNQTNARAVGNTQTVGTTEELLAVGDLTTPAECYLRNLDSTNFVTVGVKPAATYYPAFRLKASSAMPLCGLIESGVSLYVKADTAACDIDILILDE